MPLKFFMPHTGTEFPSWSGGIEASNDADVSSILHMILYGGFSPVRLEGWHIRRDALERGLPSDRQL